MRHFDKDLSRKGDKLQETDALRGRAPWRERGGMISMAEVCRNSTEGMHVRSAPGLWSSGVCATRGDEPRPRKRGIGEIKVRKRNSPWAIKSRLCPEVIDISYITSIFCRGAEQDGVRLGRAIQGTVVIFILCWDNYIGRY